MLAGEKKYLVTRTELQEELNKKLDIDGDSKDNIITFTSSDTSESNEWTDVSTLTSGEKHSSIFSKMSQMFKNVRYLWKLMGTTDISSIGDGTMSGAIGALNENKLGKTANAVSASKLSNTSAIGSATQPVYFNANGVPVAGTYELNKSVPSDAKFTDTTYPNATTSVAGLMSANDKKKIDNSLWIDLKGDAAKTTSFPLANIATGIYLVAFSNLYEDAGLYSFGVLFYYNNGYAGYNQITERHSTGSAYSISVNNGVVTSNRDIQNAKAIKIGYVNV